jgi:hypothetical protein
MLRTVLSAAVRAACSPTPLSLNDLDLSRPKPKFRALLNDHRRISEQVAEHRPSRNAVIRNIDETCSAVGDPAAQRIVVVKTETQLVALRGGQQFALDG